MTHFGTGVDFAGVCSGTVRTMLQAGRSRVRLPMVSLEFFININTCMLHYGTGVDSASNKNEHQINFLGGGLRWAVHRADNITTFM